MVNLTYAVGELEVDLPCEVVVENGESIYKHWFKDGERVDSTE